MLGNHLDSFKYVTTTRLTRHALLSVADALDRKKHLKQNWHDSKTLVGFESLT